jgi:hypothetical protein
MNEAAYRALPGSCRDTLDSFRQSPFLEYRRTFPHEPDHRGRSGLRSARDASSMPASAERTGAYAAEHGDISR